MGVLRHPAAAARRVLAAVARPGGGPPRLGRPPAPGTWADVDPDGTVHLHPPVPEVGQGSHTVLAQLVLEELGGDLDRVVTHPPDTARGFPIGWLTAVGGSTAQTLDLPARRAGAALRAGRRRPPALRPEGEHRLVGTPAPRVDLPAKTSGAAVFTTDVHLPGMLHGAVATPPRPGAVLAGVRRLAEARALPGVRAVVVDERAGFAGVAATRPRQAAAALAALDPTWTGGSTAGEEDVRRAVTVPPGGGHVLQLRGDPDAALAAGRRLTAEYRTPMVAADPPEPPVAVADVTPSAVTVYASTQNPGLLRAGVARVLRRRASGVRVVVPYVGGSFGRKHGHLGDPAADAARLSAAAGRPVRLAWTRPQELQHGPRRPPTHHVLDAALGPRGDLVALQHRMASGDGSASWPLTGRLARAADLDLMAVFGAHLVYDRVPHLRMQAARVPLPLPLTGLRSLGTSANTFAVESFVDELASLAGADPVEFRLRSLGTDDVGRRLRRALEAAAGAGGWGTAAEPGTARGIACCAYGRTVVAHVVQAELVGPPAGGTGPPRLRARRVTAAVEGRFVNPGIARQQSEGGVVMGLSWALVEQVRLEDGRVVTDDADRYPLLGAGDVPDVTTVLLDGDHRGGGVNEATTAPVAAALANAAFALTGHRLRDLPLRLPAGTGGWVPPSPDA